MPAKKSSTPVQSSTKTATKAKAGTAAPEVPKKTSVTAKMPAKPAAKSTARKTAADELDVVEPGVGGHRAVDQSHRIVAHARCVIRDGEQSDPVVIVVRARGARVFQQCGRHRARTPLELHHAYLQALPRQVVGNVGARLFAVTGLAAAWVHHDHVDRGGTT